MRFRKRGAEARGILLRHRPQAKVVGPFLGQTKANEPTSILGHEIDRFRSDKLRRQRQVSLVLPVLVVHYDDHAPRLEFLEGPRYIGKRRFACMPYCPPDTFLLSHRFPANAKSAALGGVLFASDLLLVYNVDSISKPQASSSASGIYFEFLLRRAHSRNRVERTY